MEEVAVVGRWALPVSDLTWALTSAAPWLLQTLDFPPPEGPFPVPGPPPTHIPTQMLWGL
jgi:hypothetical protein